ncbi:MAG TPA: thioredoxin family protein [Burkholderiales bacterium]|jgi:peroxiredoxin|nr:thioredoxin family protein [Burkholderiales bacterium]
MIGIVRDALVACIALGLVGAAYAAVAPGRPAPDFALTGIDGKPYRLSDFRGKYVVLEWFNSECPFVQKHYESGNMQSLQAKYSAKDVVWIGINSTSPRHSNYRDPARSQAILKEWKSNPSAFLLDPAGSVGQTYGARTTPHMYIVDPSGNLVYMGGIDDKPSISARDIPGAKNYVAKALDELLAGKPVSENSTRPYGCSIKYAD